MTALALDSFEARGFRGFNDLKITHLGRMNLIVGKNNVGKTSLLEALYLYAARGDPAVVWAILEARNEGRQQPPAPRPRDSEEILSSLRYLFYGRPDPRSRHDIAFELGPSNHPDELLHIGLKWQLIRNGVEEAQLSMSWGVEPQTVNIPIEMLRDIAGPQFLVPLPAPAPECVIVSAHGLTLGRIGELWDNVSLTDLEHFVLDALRIIAPGVDRLTLVADRASPDIRIPIVKLAGVSDPMPLRSLGGGMQRAFGIALALVNARDGMLLIDEIENGLHYLVQPEIWKLLFQTARQLNAQVFATTHSWDCIRAFQRVAAEDQATEGALIRLDLEPDGITSTIFNEDELGIATRDQIEVR